jgi:hypothetical protein
MERVVDPRVAAPIAVVLMLGLAAGFGPGILRAADPPWDPPGCPPGAAVPDIAADRRAAASDARGASWFRLDAELDGAGWLTSHRLWIGTTGAPARYLELGPEAFATGPYDGIVLVGEDDGIRSRLLAVHPGQGCGVDLGETADVVRSAVMGPRGDALFEHRVNRATRADDGVWRRPLDGGVPARILAPLPEVPAFGPTFGTELAIGPDGRVAVASCGERACRVRVIDPASGEVRQIDPIGQLVGLGAREIVAYGVCPGLPCPIEAIDIDHGTRRVLAAAAGMAVLAGQAADLLVHEAEPGLIRSVQLDSGTATVLGRIAGDSQIVPASSRSGAGMQVPAGFVVMARDGRLAGGDVTMLDARNGSRIVLKGVGR